MARFDGCANPSHVCLSRCHAGGHPQCTYTCHKVSPGTLVHLVSGADLGQGKGSGARNAQHTWRGLRRAASALLVGPESHAPPPPSHSSIGTTSRGKGRAPSVHCTVTLGQVVGNGDTYVHCHSEVGSRHWVSFSILPHYNGQWAVGLLQYTTTLQRAVGSGAASLYCHTVVGNGQCHSFGILPHWRLLCWRLCVVCCAPMATRFFGPVASGHLNSRPPKGPPCRSACWYG